MQGNSNLYCANRQRRQIESSWSSSAKERADENCGDEIMKCNECSLIETQRIETRDHSIIVSRCEACWNEEIRVMKSKNCDTKLLRLIWAEQFSDLLYVGDSQLSDEIARYSAEWGNNNE